MKIFIDNKIPENRHISEVNLQLGACYWEYWD